MYGPGPELSALRILAHSFHSYHYCPHFTGAKTKLQIGNFSKVTKPTEVVQVGLYPGLLDSRSHTAVKYKRLLEMFHG